MTSHPIPAWEERELRGAVQRWPGGGVLRALASVMVPFLAPTASPMVNDAARRWWRIVCALSVLPVTALLHWAVFHRPTCILNNFGHEYTPAVIGAWLMRDPALPWAMVAMGAAYWLGLSRSLVRAVIAPGFAAGFLFTLWIWDIPLSGRAVCGHFHDNVFMLAEGVPLRSVHVLGVCTVLYGVSMLWVLPRFVRMPARRRNAGALAAGGVVPVGIPALAGAAYPKVRFNPELER